MFETRFTEKFGVKYPIMQGALGYLSGAELVAAVSNAGGLGTLETISFANTDELRREIRKTKSLTAKPVAANIPFLLSRKLISSEQVIEVIIDEGVPVVETISAGKLPDNVLRSLKQSGVKIIHKCTKVKHAQAVEQQGVDAVVILGSGADGHPSVEEISLLVQVPKAVATLKIPVIAAGGIADARGFVAALALGADAVLMGTRFLTAQECPIHPRIREWLLQAEETDVVLVDVTHGNPSRTMRNKTATAIIELEKRGAPIEEILPLLSGQRTAKAWKEGDIDGGSFGCGQVIGLINEILTAREIIERMVNEAQAIIARLDSLVDKKKKR